MNVFRSEFNRIVRDALLCTVAAWTASHAFHDVGVHLPFGFFWGLGWCYRHRAGVLVFVQMLNKDWKFEEAFREGGPVK